MANFTSYVHSWIYLYLLLLCFIMQASSEHILYSISEEVKQGTFVGNLAKDLNLNVQDMESRMLQIVSASKKSYFDVNLKTGILFVNERVDREEICPNARSCALHLEAIVNHPLSLHRVEINVMDINDNSPTFPVKEQVFDISESVLLGARFSLMSALDPDVGSNGVKTYKLSPNECFSLEVQSGGEQSVSAELVLKKALDREKQAVVKHVVTTADGGKPAQSGTLEIVVNVLDINDNSPVFSSLLYKVRVYKNAAPGTKILKLNATDLYEGPNGEVLYLFSRHGQENNLDTFSINPVSGDITVKGVIDFEETAFYEIRAEARDKGQSAMGSHCKVLVEVVDVNDNIPEIRVTSLLPTVREDIETGTAIALILVIDKDGGNNGKVNCRLMGESPFNLQSSYRNHYSVVLNGALDRVPHNTMLKL
ncbi:protocadherin alpha-10-like [Salmo salar]|uniref:Protocadherin alpha-10-like n=1 Tax=Salmo salar TaxID=8030 RepID=A0ABM3EPH7_SALSA|nr:protocadherin alpha-10-like [Salmo salar]